MGFLVLSECHPQTNCDIGRHYLWTTISEHNILQLAVISQCLNDKCTKNTFLTEVRPKHFFRNPTYSIFHFPTCPKLSVSANSS